MSFKGHQAAFALALCQVCAAQNSQVPYYQMPHQQPPNIPPPVANNVHGPQAIRNNVTAAGAGIFVGSTSIPQWHTWPMRDSHQIAGLIDRPYGIVNDINEDRLAVGGTGGDTLPRMATLWRFWTAEPIPVLAGATLSSAFGISEDGKIVGHSTGGGNRYFIVRNGVAESLGAAPSLSPDSMRVNDAGQVVVQDDVPLFYNGTQWFAGTGYENDINNLGNRVGVAGILRFGRPYSLGGTMRGAGINSKDWVCGGSYVWTPTTGRFSVSELGRDGEFSYLMKGIDEAGNIGLTYNETTNTLSGMARVIRYHDVLGIRALRFSNGLGLMASLSSAWETADGRSVRIVRLARGSNDPPIVLEVEGQGPVLTPEFIRFRAIVSSAGATLPNMTVDFWNWTSQAWEGTTMVYDTAANLHTARVEGTGLERFVRQSDGRWMARLRSLTAGQTPVNTVDIDLACWIVR